MENLIYLCNRNKA